MRVLGLDLGTRRIGIALSDEDAVHAFPEGVLERAGRDRDLAALCELIRERGVTRAVVGLPIHMDGRRGPEAQAAERFARDLAKVAGVPVDTLDERWTSREAERVLRETGGSRRGRASRSRAKPGSIERADRARGKGRVDAVAASIILRTYLERERADATRKPTGRS